MMDGSKMQGDPLDDLHAALKAPIAHHERVARACRRVMDFENDMIRQGHDVSTDVLERFDGPHEFTVTVIVARPDIDTAIEQDDPDAEVAVASGTGREGAAEEEGVGDTAPSAAPDETPPISYGRLTPAQEADILAYCKDGMSNAEIARRLGRDPKGFHFTVKRVLRDAAERAKADALSVTPGAPPSPRPAGETSPVASSQADSPGGAEDPISAGFDTADRAERARLAKVPSASGFDRDNDLALVEGLARGRKLGRVAADLGLGTEDCRARLQQLRGADDTIDGQIRLLRVLRQLVKEETA